MDEAEYRYVIEIDQGSLMDPCVDEVYETPTLEEALILGMLIRHRRPVSVRIFDRLQDDYEVWDLKVPLLFPD
ncbi:MAG: hypothetical protein KIT79_00955 [Deltaproteobacteria bacterium]|nr:hypothetical protein [Deltaproteobacteria bacterium]